MEGHFEVVPNDEQVRSQTFKTMLALERWANASIDFMTADKRPDEQNEGTPGQVLDYSRMRVSCKNCMGTVIFEDYDRKHHSPADTCTCDTVSLDDIDVPPDVRAVYKTVYELRALANVPIVACPGCRRPSVVNDPTKLCTLCLRRAHVKNWDKDKDVDYRFEGDVLIKGDLIVEGSQTAVETNVPTAPLDSDVEEIRKQLDSHRKALAIIAEYGGFKNVVFGMDPDRQIRSLVGLRACPECVGTGWLARDETCKNCGSKGYLKA